MKIRELRTFLGIFLSFITARCQQYFSGKGSAFHDIDEQGLTFRNILKQVSSKLLCYLVAYEEFDLTSSIYFMELLMKLQNTLPYK